MKFELCRKEFVEFCRNEHAYESSNLHNFIIDLLFIFK